MKNADKSVKAGRNFEEIVSRLSENEILDIEAMSCVRGGSGEGDPGIPIIITKF